jgi:hypothetical protein
VANDGGGASLEYGKAGSVVRRFGGLGSKDGDANVGGAVHAHAEITMMRSWLRRLLQAFLVHAVVRPVAIAEEGMDVDDEGRERDRSPVIPTVKTWTSHQLSNTHSSLPLRCYLLYSRSQRGSPLSMPARSSTPT